MPETCRVFISYAHDSEEHKSAVLDLSNFLLNPGGLEASIDRYVEDSGVPEGWPKWMEIQIKVAKYVLVVCSQRYYERYYQEATQDGKGLGVKWESVLVSNSIYTSESKNNKFLPVVFSDNDVRFIPDSLSGQTRYNVSTESGKINLYRKLTNQPRTVMPEKSGTIMLLDKHDIIINPAEQVINELFLQPQPIIKEFQEMKPGARIVQAYYSLPPVKRWAIASELGLIERNEELSNTNIDLISRTFLERAYNKKVLMALWNKLFDETIDPNPFKNTSK